MDRSFCATVYTAMYVVVCFQPVRCLALNWRTFGGCWWFWRLFCWFWFWSSYAASAASAARETPIMVTVRSVLARSSTETWELWCHASVNGTRICQMLNPAATSYTRSPVTESVPVWAHCMKASRSRYREDLDCCFFSYFDNSRRPLGRRAWPEIQESLHEWKKNNWCGSESSTL